MELCKTDVKNIITLLSQASAFYAANAKRYRDADKPRLLNKMIKKLNKKLETYDKA